VFSDSLITLPGRRALHWQVWSYFCDFDFFKISQFFPLIFTLFVFLKCRFCGSFLSFFRVQNSAKHPESTPRAHRTSDLRIVRRSADFSKNVFFGVKRGGIQNSTRICKQEFKCSVELPKTQHSAKILRGEFRTSGGARGWRAKAPRMAAKHFTPDGARQIRRLAAACAKAMRHDSLQTARLTQSKRETREFVRVTKENFTRTCMRMYICVVHIKKNLAH